MPPAMPVGACGHCGSRSQAVWKVSAEGALSPRLCGAGTAEPLVARGEDHGITECWKEPSEAI